MHKREELKYIISFFSSFLFFGFFALPALAQDAIQCKPPVDANSGVNLNSNLRLVNTADDTLNDIYLGTGEIYFDSNFSGPYATKSGSDLFLYSPAAVLFQSANDATIQSGGNILFKNSGGVSLGGIYPNIGASTPATDDDRVLIIHGKIEGYQVNARGTIALGGGLCVQGNCIDTWPAGSCGPNEKLTKNGTTFTCSADIDTRCDANGTCAQLCIGASCINSWAQVTSIATGGGNITNTLNQMTFGGGTTFLIDNGATFKNAGTFQVCDAGGVNCVGTGRGVSKIIDGDGPGGISLNPPANDASADGDVTIGLNLAAASFDCQHVKYDALIESWFPNIEDATPTADPRYDSDCNIPVANPAPGVGYNISLDTTTCPAQIVHRNVLSTNATAQDTSALLNYTTECPATYVVTGIIPPDTPLNNASIPIYKPRESGFLICCKLQ